ncbi:MAG TPA: AmmeMemoRadiSam system protein B [Terriglobales bacterium]|nr:AmmeMemoRadiSam system protein B [Terriglobales bacterium]
MSASVVRHPAVAGQFYPKDQNRLMAELQAYLRAEAEPAPALGCIAPHAGYMYSGHVAGAVYAHLAIPQRCIVLCPNHTGYGTPLSVMAQGVWETPLGDVAIDSFLAASLLRSYPLLSEDSEAHRGEHAIEVQLPFLLARRSDLRFVPIAIGTRQYGALEGLGHAIANVVADFEERVLVVASSDMNHYESDAVTRIKDQKAIERILALDPAGLNEVVTQEHVSMCGYGPAIVMLTAAKQMGAKSAELVKYATSGDISGDRRMVVGYAGIVVR